MSYDVLQIIHMCFTGITVVGGIVLGYLKLRNKKEDHDDDKLSKFLTAVDDRLEKHVIMDAGTHKTLEDRMDRTIDIVTNQGNLLAALDERTKNELRVLDKLDEKLSQLEREL